MPMACLLCQHLKPLEHALFKKSACASFAALIQPGLRRIESEIPVMPTACSAPPLAFGETRTWLLGQYALLTVSASILLWVFEHTDLDREVIRYFFNPTRGEFPLRHAWLLDAVLHQGAKMASYILVTASLYYCWQGWKNRLTWLPPRNAMLAAIGMLAIPLATTTLKLLTQRHCPWDIVDFGGYAPYSHLFEILPESVKVGQCFPAGHASAGFLWLVWAVALRPAGVRAARLGLLAGLLAGGLFGAARMLQGAHFLSHTLWTLWLAWAMSVGLAVLMRADIRSGP